MKAHARMPELAMTGAQQLGKVLEEAIAAKRIDGLPQEKVTPPKALLERIAADNRAIAQTRESRRAVAEFLGGFALPVEGAVVSGVFGSQRT